jgi:hypothetical protein
MFQILTNLTVSTESFMSFEDMMNEKDFEDMTEEERNQHELENLEDEYHMTQNEMDSPTGEDD